MRGMLLAGAGVMALCGMESAPRAQSTEQQPLQRQIDELRRLLNQQQRMIIQQQQTIGQQQQTIGDLQTRVGSLQGQQADIQQQAQDTRQRVVDKPLIASSNPRMRVTLSGQVDRLLNLADDGKNTKAYFVDNNVSVSRLRFAATGQVTDDFSMGTNLELAISPNNSGDVSQVNEDGSQKDEFRKVEAVFKSKKFGEIDFGKGDPATKDIAKLDLSGTDVLAYASTGDPAGGLLFRTKDSEELTTTDIGDVFTDFDAGRTNRIRYDTPKFYGAFASASYGADQKWGVATRWAGVGHGLKATAGAGIQDPSKDGIDVVYAGSASFLHEATGLNLTYGTALQQQDEGTGQLQYVKAGWQHDFFPLGSTAFSIDFGFDKDTPGDGDEGRTVGLVALQNLTDYGTELFAGFRSYDFDDGDGPNTSTIYVGTAGTRVKF